MDTTNTIRNLKQTILYTFKKLKFLYKYWLFFIHMSFVSLILAPLFTLRPKNVKNSIFLTEATKHITKLIGIKWYLRNQAVLGVNSEAVIVANHQSSFDILGMTNIWYALNKCAIVCKIDLFFTPIGPALYLMGTIFLNRKRGKESQIKLKKHAENHFKNKVKIWIFPEGTRNSNGKKMLQFKTGAFNIAISSQVPIIPVVFSPYYFINKKELIFNKGHVIAQCLDPIPTKGLTLDDLPALIERVQNVMVRQYKELLSEVTKDLPENYPLAI